MLHTAFPVNEWKRRLPAIEAMQFSSYKRFADDIIPVMFRKSRLRSAGTSIQDKIRPEIVALFLAEPDLTTQNWIDARDCCLAYSYRSHSFFLTNIWNQMRSLGPANHAMTYSPLLQELRLLLPSKDFKVYCCNSKFPADVKVGRWEKWRKRAADDFGDAPSSNPPQTVDTF